jgi:hypothetical protein
MARKAATIKLASFSKLPLIKGSINGKEAYFIIDSGATVTVLNSNMADEFGFRVEEDLDGEAAGYGGKAHFMKAAAVTIKTDTGIELWAPDIKAQDLSPIVNAVKNNENVTVSGIIGTNIIKKYEFIINFKDYTINFTY